MGSGAGQVFEIAKANYRRLTNYCGILDREGYFKEAEKIIHKSIYECLDYYVQSLLIHLAVYGGRFGEEEMKFIISLPDSRQYPLEVGKKPSEEMVREAEAAVKAPPILMQLLALRDREKNTSLSASYMDMILNLIVAMSFLNDRKEEFLVPYIMDYYHSVQAFIYFSDKAERMSERYLFRKASGDLTLPESPPTEDTKEKEEESREEKIRTREDDEKVCKEGTTEKSLSYRKENSGLDRLIHELESLVGLQAVKEEVRSLINLIHIRRIRKEKGLPFHEMSYHMVFTGSPGTGKTTVARLIAEVYKELGILSKGTLTEVDRSGLVAGFVGQTALKVSEVVKKALGGVLFIDEAYALYSPGNGNDFGSEAIDTLVKLMEDHREDLVVIAAGYTKGMEVFLKANTGLVSRFNKFIEFQDYSSSELFEIMLRMAEKMEMHLSAGAAKKLEIFLSKMNEEERILFGNARGIRNLFERMLAGQANRLAKIADPTVEELSEIIEEDFEI